VCSPPRQQPSPCWPWSRRTQLPGRTDGQTGHPGWGPEHSHKKAAAEGQVGAVTCQHSMVQLLDVRLKRIHPPFGWCAGFWSAAGPDHSQMLLGCHRSSSCTCWVDTLQGWRSAAKDTSTYLLVALSWLSSVALCAFLQEQTEAARVNAMTLRLRGAQKHANHSLS
jgi:hypothetical protein